MARKLRCCCARQREHVEVVGRALDAAVPRAVVALAVVVVLAVGLVVLLVVGDEVVQREAVVGGDEVDAGEGAAARAAVEVAAAGEAVAELGQGLVLAPPEVAHGVAVLAVPLRPQRREVADLVAALADVPRLGDELDLADDRVLLDEVEERRQPVDVVQLAGERGGQVEAEAVDVHLGHPVPQAVHDQLQHVRVAHVQAVAGARVVHVVARVVGVEPVVGGVVDAPERQHRAQVVALGRVVVDDVEDHLDAGLVQGLHHLLELLHLLARLPARAVLVVGREEADRVVAPVVAQPVLDQHGVVHELVHGHELDRGDAEALQVVDDRRAGEARVGAAQLLGHVGVEHGHALDVGLVDDRLVQRRARVAVVVPVEVRVGDDGLGHERRAVVVVAAVGVAEVVREHGLVPLDLALERLGVGVEQQLGRVAAVAVLGRVGAVDAEAVALARADVGEVAVPAEGRRLGQVDARLGAVLVEQAQLDALGDLAEQREVGAAPVVVRAERKRLTWPHLHPIQRTRGPAGLSHCPSRGTRPPNLGGLFPRECVGTGVRSSRRGRSRPRGVSRRRRSRSRRGRCRSPRGRRRGRRPRPCPARRSNRSRCPRRPCPGPRR